MNSFFNNPLSSNLEYSVIYLSIYIYDPTIQEVPIKLKTKKKQKKKTNKQKAIDGNNENLAAKIRNKGDPRITFPASSPSWFVCLITSSSTTTMFFFFLFFFFRFFLKFHYNKNKYVSAIISRMLCN